MAHKATIFEKHQFRIAKDTLRMPDAMIGVMGQSKAEAKRLVRDLKAIFRRRGRK